MTEFERRKIENEIAMYQVMLSQTDYKAIKHADGALSDDDYAETKSKRQSWRDKINELEAQMNAE